MEPGITNTNQERKHFHSLFLFSFLFIVIIVLKYEAQISAPFLLNSPLVDLHCYCSLNVSFLFRAISRTILDRLTIPFTAFSTFSHLFVKKIY
jgi:hypothetical protein